MNILVTKNATFVFADWLKLVDKLIDGLALPSAVTIYYKGSHGFTGKVTNQSAENIHKTLKKVSFTCLYQEANTHLQSPK